MKEVLIDGIIGYDWWTESGVTAKSVKKQLEGIKDGEEINITINSPGGSVFEGVVIFNMIRDYAKTHPVSTKINCRAMSMGSYIALAARTVNRESKLTASENSVVLIHNPWGASVGDYRTLRKDADYFEKLAVLYGSVHTALSVKSEKEIRAAMDEETCYVGKEIEGMGWANDFENISETENTAGENAASARDALIANALNAMEQAKAAEREARMKNPTAYRSDLEKAVALCKTDYFTKNTIDFAYENKPSAAEGAETSGKINSGGAIKMTLDELKAQNKPLYDSVFALGETSGIEKERARVNAHLLLGEKSGSLTVAAKHIKAGVSISDETALAEYHAAKLDATHLAARNNDNVGDVSTGGESGGAIDNAKIEAAFKNGYAGKKIGGERWEE
jgi:ATP-dependent protease ClpP protease subunit